jgi:hypothetical protein
VKEALRHEKQIIKLKNYTLERDEICETCSRFKEPFPVSYHLSVYFLEFI